MSGGEHSFTPAPLGDPGAYRGRPELDPGWNATTWDEIQPEPTPRKALRQKTRGALSLAGFVLVTLALLPPFFALRAMGGRRDRRIAALWCAIGLRFCGMRLRRQGEPLRGGGALLANHASWIDIMAIGSQAPVYFVAKAEVERWPIVGWIGRICDTEFIARRRAAAKQQELRLAARARSGDLLSLFPEGTSSDGKRVLTFKSTLFSLFYAESDAPLMAQAVTIHYRPRPGLAPNFYGWWGRMPLFKHIWDVTCLGSGGVATVQFHPPMAAQEFADRKAMAAAAQKQVSEGLEQAARTAS